MAAKGKTTGIGNWPQDDRPREKLLKNGAPSLSNSELLAILLRTGTAGASAIDIARRIFAKFGSFRNMLQTDPRDWKEFKGIGPAKIAHIRAALEIGWRVREVEAGADRRKIARDVADILMPQMRDLKTEVFKIVYLDGSNCIIAVAAAAGTVNQAIPIIREIIHAASIICAHNHPSGRPDPSTEDRAFTKELVRAGQTLQVKILDRVIIGADKYYNFADEGQIL